MKIREHTSQKQKPFIFRAHQYRGKHYRKSKVLSANLKNPKGKSRKKESPILNIAGLPLYYMAVFLIVRKDELIRIFTRLYFLIVKTVQCKKKKNDHKYYRNTANVSPS